MSLIVKAANAACLLHLEQKRKYNGDPYIYHPMRVAGMVCLVPGVLETTVAAAWLHDVLEDCQFQERPMSVADLKYMGFPCKVNTLVAELTNPSKQHPELERADRKTLDRKHLMSVSQEAKLIKAYDRLDNLRELSLQGAPVDFKRLYAEESLQLADALQYRCNGPQNPAMELAIQHIRTIAHPMRLL
jgi:(p)ppGpp synthase/HD superfamily hydrolase